MSLQRLPIGAVTSPHAVRARHRLRRWRLGRARPHVVLAACGLAAAAVGAVLALSPAPVDVRMAPDRYVIAGNTLVATAPGVYQGPGAVLVVRASGGQTLAAASTTLGGRPMTGRCAMAPGGAAETCRFTIGGRALGAVDSRARSGWSRRYDDGRTVEITVEGARPAPVPFAV